MRVIHLLTLLILYAPLGVAQHVYTDSFPTNDEYDMMALDPGTPYGSPYGGFSRATASRLASLPLKLPDVGEDFADFEPIYTTVRDSQGRPFVCRVYHEDELEPSSLTDSMFNTPKLKQESRGSQTRNKETRVVATDIGTTIEKTAGESSKVDAIFEDTRNVQSADSISEEKKGQIPSESNSEAEQTSPSRIDPVLRVQEIHQRLTKLSGLCAQMHPDWWSYEWCYKAKVTQFHINLDSLQAGNTNAIQLEDITNLGKYSDRRIQLDSDFRNDIHDTKRPKSLSNKIEGLDFTEGRKEIARVIDSFIGGDICPETGKPRVTESILRCCSERILGKTKGGVLKNGRPVATDVVTIVQTSEWSEAVCHYNITLCTPLLCDDASLNDHDKTPKGRNKKKSRRSGLNLNLDPDEVEKMSVPEVLNKTFGDSEDFCIQTGTGGWWVYEFCVGEYVRQFHETTLIDRVSGQARTSVDAEHILGRFISADHDWVTKDNEWKNVVNASESGLASNTKSSNSKAARANKLPTNFGGNGAYYFQEYTKGDVCDHEDVTDSAIKAGAFGEGGIERATTVRYSCGIVVNMLVKEDSTCHYIVDITVPTLCYHPLFKAPVTKKQVVKCLPLPLS